MTGMAARALAWLGLLMWAAALPGPARAQVLPEAEPLAADLREEVTRLSVTVKDLYGRRETRQIALTSFRPAGDGPFPLLVMNHGRASSDRRAEQGRQRYDVLARYLVAKGFAVFVPTRVGYGDTLGPFDPEDMGSCSQMRPQAAADAAADQVLATVAHAKTLPWVDAARWVVMGQSVGGLAVLAVAARQPPGLVAAINFAGGAGGSPDLRPGNPCSPLALSRLFESQGATASLPVLWIYWRNDRYWGAEWPRRWAQAWTDGGGKPVFHQLPDAGRDGHGGLRIDMDGWVPLVETHLAAAGYTRSGLVPRPPASGYAAIDEIDKLPLPPPQRERLYRRFLASPAPRAFAVGPDGAAGHASGDWAAGRALGFCQAARGAACRLYAVDDDVVWVP